MLSLQPILPNEDRTKQAFQSEDCQNLLAMWEEFYPTIGYQPPWSGYFILENEEVVGSCALIRQSDGRAEISYWTFTAHQGKGIAKWACGELISIARLEEPSIILYAKTAPEENSSVSVLKHNGFHFSGIVQDHEIGDAWEWVLLP